MLMGYVSTSRLYISHLKKYFACRYGVGHEKLTCFSRLHNYRYD